MPFDRACAEEELCAYLRVREADPGEPGDLLLLRRELVARLVATLAHLLARCDQLAASALCERLHPDRDEHVVGRAQLLSRVETSPLAAQPLPVEQMRTGELRTESRTAEPIDRFAVGLF